MCNCAWKILRGASDASTESAMVAAFAPKLENDDNRNIAKQKSFVALKREPIPPPDFRFAPRRCNWIRTDLKTPHEIVSLNISARSVNSPPLRRSRAFAIHRHRDHFHLLSSRRARAWKIYYLRRSRWQRQEHPG